jgi:diguanylate cyclase (GGDEF)-like protein/PAS domain S-box-containing protein
VLAGRVPSFAVDVQYLVAGLALALAPQHWLLGLGGRRSSTAAWFAVSSVALAGALGANVWLFEVSEAQLGVAVFVRSALLSLAVLVQVPTIASFANKSWPKRSLSALVLLTCTQLVLWQTTRLVYEHRVGSNGSPVYGPLAVVFTALQLLLLVGLVVHLARGWADVVERSVFLAGFATSFGAIMASLAAGDTPLGELLAGYWVIPWVVALQILFVRRVLTMKSAARKAEQTLWTSEQRFRPLVAGSSDLIALINNRAELDYANPAAQRLLGLVPEDFVGRNMLELVHPEDLEAVMVAFSRDISQRGVHPPAVYRFQAASGEWRNLEVSATNCLDDPAIAGIVINARDVTEQTNLTRALRTLGQANQVLVHAADESSLLVDTCKTIVDAGGYRLAWVGYVEHDERRTVRPMASSGELRYLNEVHISWGDNERGNGPIAMAIRNGSVQVAEDLRRTAASPESLVAAADGLRTNCVLPLQVGGEVIGALSIYAIEPRAFGPSEVSLLSELGDALAYGIGRLRDADLLHASEERFRVLASSSPIGILEVSSGTSVDYANRRAAEISGRDVEELMGGGWVDTVLPEDVPMLLSVVERARSDRAEVTKRFRIRRPDSEIRHVRMSAAARGAELDSGYVVTVEDVTEEVLAQEELAHQALHDALTGLPNRALFLDRLNQELARLRRGGSNIAVLFLGLDRFKIVNDSLGHETGDTVLKELGVRFMRAVRAGETVARFSGDEFIFIMRDIHKIQDAVTAAKRLQALIESPVHYSGHDLTVTGSVGIVIPQADANAGMILRDANSAMYQAKAAGRNTYALFDEDLHRRSVERVEMENELRRALDNQEFELYYQPGVEPKSGRPIGAEALIRWNHPVRGLVSPLDFIPVAEDSGLILPIGRWVLEQAMAQLAAWDAEKDGPRLEVVAVNLSARQLDDAETPGIVRDVLERYGIAAGRVSLEITESVIMIDSESTRRALETFKELGLRVAIDDFGTGYSSLAYLHALPVTTVKIDQSFVERLGSEEDSTPVVRAIIEMSHAIGLRVMAEGVEDEVRRVLVASLGCDFAQGFHWARPIPAEAFADWWQDAERRAAAG